MSTKPTVVPEWATDGTNVTTPLSGQQDTGWTANELDVGPYDNWFKNKCALWLNWLNDGDVSFNDVEVLGDLEVDGAALVEGNLTTVGSHYFQTAIEHQIPVFDTVEVGGATSALGTMRRTFSAFDAAERIVYPVRAAVGEEITKWELYIDDTSGGVAPTARLFSLTAASNTETALGTLKTSSQLGYEILSDTMTPVVVEQGKSYYIKVANGQSNLLLYHASYYVKRVP